MDETSIVTSYILANMIPDNAALLDNESDNLYRALKTEVERVLIEANFLRYSKSEDTTKKYTDALIDLYPENMAKLVLAFLVDKLKRGRLFWKSVYTPGRTSTNVIFANQLFEISGSVGKENNPHWQVVFIDGIKSRTKLLQVLKNDDEFLKWCMKKLHTIERFSSDYVNREKIWERGDNLDEANKYFFGTEDANEVKKLFESVEENKKEYYAPMLRGLQHASADYMNKKLIDPISGFYEFQDWGVTLDASPIFGISKYIQNVNSEDLYTKYMSWYLFTHVFYLVMSACDEHQTSSGIKFDFIEYWWDLCNNRSIKSNDDKKFLKLFAKVFDLYYDMTFNQEKQVPSPVKKIVYKAISENV